MPSPPPLGASAWLDGAHSRAVRGGAFKVELSERASCYTTMRTVTSWYPSGRTRRATRSVQAAAAPAPKGHTAQAAAAAQAPTAASAAAADGAPRAARNARQRRSAERSAQHHRRMAEEKADGAAEAWTMADVQRVGGVDNKEGSARCATSPRSPSKRARDEAPARAVPAVRAGGPRRSPDASPSEAGETSRALVLVGEEKGAAPRAAIASPKRPRAPRSQTGAGLPCQWCGTALLAGVQAFRCKGEAPMEVRGGGAYAVRCAPSAEALAAAGWGR